MEKIWGVYNTFEDSNLIESMSEIDTWKAIENLGGSIFWARHDAGKPWAAKVSAKDLIDAQYNLEFLVYSTKRFGVEFSEEPSKDKHVEQSESYKKWYSFWNKHFDSMSRELYNEFVEVKNAGGDISIYLPEGNWKDSTSKKIK